jgi:hypothetical protein
LSQNKIITPRNITNNIGIPVGIEGRRQRAFTLVHGRAKWSSIIPGHITQDVKLRQQCGVFVGRFAQIPNLAVCRRGICPLGVTRRIIVCRTIGRSGDIAVNCNIQWVEGIGEVECRGDVEGYELELQGVRFQDGFVQTVIKVDESCGGG